MSVAEEALLEQGKAHEEASQGSRLRQNSHGFMFEGVGAGGVQGQQTLGRRTLRDGAMCYCATTVYERTGRKASSLGNKPRIMPEKSQCKAIYIAHAMTLFNASCSMQHLPCNLSHCMRLVV